LGAPSSCSGRFWDRLYILLIDDVDAGLETATLVRPEEAVAAIKDVSDRLSGQVIAKLRERQTVWVLGASADIDAWQTDLSDLLAVKPEEIGIVRVERKVSLAETESKSEPGPRAVVRPPPQGGTEAQE
jgi:hypothetical protein